METVQLYTSDSRSIVFRIIECWSNQGLPESFKRGLKHQENFEVKNEVKGKPGRIERENNNRASRAVNAEVDRRREY
jgi:hypothetical protein